MYGRQPHLPVDVALGLVLHSVMAPTTLKYVQTLREHVQWAHKKAKLFQAKEAQCHKLNYDKHVRAAVLEVGDTVLVHVTAFKGCHKIQNQWENNKYVVERGPSPNVPVCAVCPRDGDGCSQTLHGNYLLPISPNSEQAGDDIPVVGVEQVRTSAPIPSVDSDPSNSEPSGMAMLHATSNTSQGSQDQPVPLTCGTCSTEPTSMVVPQFCTISRYQPAWHPGCVAWSVHLPPPDAMLVHNFCGKYNVNTLYLYHLTSAKHCSF